MQDPEEGRVAGASEAKAEEDELGIVFCQLA